jgi:plastocyanin
MLMKAEHMKKLAPLLLILVVLSLVVACSGTSGPTSPAADTVHTVGALFSPTTITIKKGTTITFVDDADNGALHILVIGQNAQQINEQGAPDFGGASGTRIDIGDTWTTPPWPTAGTFHVACTVHPAMNLTVTVTN